MGSVRTPEPGEQTDGRTDLKGSLHADDTTLMSESEEELKSLLMKVKEEMLA